MDVTTDSEPTRGERLSQLFEQLIVAYVDNVMRAGEAYLTHVRLAATIPVAIHEVPTLPAGILTEHSESLAGALDELTKIIPAEYSSWMYVNGVSLMVYYTTLFDTFLQDVIEFLLCSHPGAMSDSDVSFSQIIRAEARHEIINTAIKAKVREVGFKSFVDQLAWMRRKFGLKFNIDRQLLDELVRCSEQRNLAVHDQGWFDFCIGEDGEVAIIQCRCYRRPTASGNEDVDAMRYAYGRVAVAVSEAVLTQVLKTSVSPSARKALDAVPVGQR